MLMDFLPTRYSQEGNNENVGTRRAALRIMNLKIRIIGMRRPLVQNHSSQTKKRATNSCSSFFFSRDEVAFGPEPFVPNKKKSNK